MLQEPLMIFEIIVGNTWACLIFNNYIFILCVFEILTAASNVSSGLWLLWKPIKCRVSSIFSASHSGDFARSPVFSMSAIWSALPSKYIHISTVLPLWMLLSFKWSRWARFIPISLQLTPCFSLFSICWLISESKPEPLPWSTSPLHDPPPIYTAYTALWPHLLPLLVLTLLQLHWPLWPFLSTPGVLPPRGLCLCFSFSLKCSSPEPCSPISHF